MGFVVYARVHNIFLYTGHASSVLCLMRVASTVSKMYRMLSVKLVFLMIIILMVIIVIFVCCLIKNARLVLGKINV